MSSGHWPAGNTKQSLASHAGFSKMHVMHAAATAAEEA